MTLDAKKSIILECVRLGMSEYESMLLANCSDDEMQLINDDELFMKRMELTVYEKERELLELHNEAIMVAVEKGNTNGIQWRLEKLNPGRYTKTVNNNVNADVNANLQGKLEHEHKFDIDKLSLEEKKRIEEEYLAAIREDLAK